MVFVPRDYQDDCIDKTFEYWSEGKGDNPLVVLPTGGGKSGVQGTLFQRLFTEYRGMRIVSATHVKELVEQNYKELIELWDWAPAGIYSAGLNRRDLSSPILFAGIQSIYRKARQLGHVDVLAIDEAHLVPTEGSGQYLSFINDLRNINPDLKIFGLTATPYRLKSGLLTEGDDRIFDGVAHEVSVRYLIEQGWLAPLVTKSTATVIDTTGVKKVGGEFQAKALQAAADKFEITRDAVEEIVALGQDRRSWLVFATGVEHAQHICEAIEAKGYRGGVITGDTPPAERAALISAFKRYELRFLVNCGVLTTGFNHPGCDLLAMLRPTQSTSLYVQICGRGTRALYAPGFNPNAPGVTAEERRAAIAAGPKPNCLVLDFARNIETHGPIDLVQPKRPGKGGGEAPVKTCPQCFSMVHASVMECPDCGHQWERQESDRLTGRAATAPILSSAEPVWHSVKSRSFFRHEKLGAPASVRVEYLCGLTTYKEWVSPENPKTAGRFKAWWRQHKGADPTPETVSDALARVSELRATAEIRVEASGKYWEITGRRLRAVGEFGAAQADAFDTSPKRHRYDLAMEGLDDGIPF